MAMKRRGRVKAKPIAIVMPVAPPTSRPALASPKLGAAMKRAGALASAGTMGPLKPRKMN